MIPHNINDASTVEAEGQVIGASIYKLVEELFPICRSITGDGVRETLKILGNFIDLHIKEVRSGTKVFDWTVPQEWNIRDAYIEALNGDRIVSFADSNLHLMSYSMPIQQRMSLHDLNPHLHSLPRQPNLIPYRTTYYAEDWGFCVRHDQREKFDDQLYNVVIDADLTNGALTYGEYFIPGQVDDEILLSTHICHPSMANDNCSGMAVLTHLAQHLAQKPRYYSYRILFVPGTIGAITWLAYNEDNIHRIKHGLVIAGVGDGGGPIYKKSRTGQAMMDRVMPYVFKQSNYSSHSILDFFPYGYDERQYCSPAIDLPIGLFQNSQFATFPQYHTSADDLSFVRPSHLQSSYKVILQALHIIDADKCYLNLQPRCEPQLGKRGLYANKGGSIKGAELAMAMLWNLSYSDGRHTLFDIAEKSGKSFTEIEQAATHLMENNLLRQQHHA